MLLMHLQQVSGEALVMPTAVAYSMPDKKFAAPGIEWFARHLHQRMARRQVNISQTKLAIAICIGAILAGCLIASITQTAGGRVRLQDIRFVGSSGGLISALLYIPENASKENPAPGVLAIHGYINSRETQSGFAIEFSRRGYVVLAIDQTGHGFSSPPAFADGFGGPDALAYLRSLAFVDKQRIGLEGHSMGGWAVLMAADSYPDAYQAMVLEGSSTGTLGAPVGTMEFPRNLGLVFSQFDEFSGFMWDSPDPARLVDSKKLQSLFGTDQRVVPGQLYGDLQQGTARTLYRPAVTHPGDHLSTEAIGDAIDWFQRTLDSENGLDAENQIWYYKELGTLICLLALAALVFPLGRYLLTTPWFSSLRLTSPALPRDTPWQVRLSILLLALIPVITYFNLQEWGNLLLPANVVWPQSITTGIMVWALFNGIVSLVLLGIKYRGFASLLPLLTGSQQDSAWRLLLKSAVLALVINLCLYSLLMIADLVFTVDFRFWVVALKLLTLDQMISVLAYLPAFTVFFVIFELALHRQLFWFKATGEAVTVQRAMLYNACVLGIGFAALLAAQYIPLFMGNTMLIPTQPLLTIVAIQFVPLLMFAAATSTWFYALTGRIYAGAFFNALFVTWYIVAGQATHLAR